MPSLQRTTPTLPASEAQRHSTTTPEAQCQLFFAQNSLKLASSSHFLTLCLPNENYEHGNEM